MSAVGAFASERRIERAPSARPEELRHAVPEQTVVNAAGIAAAERNLLAFAATTRGGFRRSGRRGGDEFPFGQHPGRNAARAGCSAAAPTRRRSGTSSR